MGPGRADTLVLTEEESQKGEVFLGHLSRCPLVVMASWGERCLAQVAWGSRGILHSEIMILSLLILGRLAFSTKVFPL